MGDLFGGQFNSADFYGVRGFGNLGDDDVVEAYPTAFIHDIDMGTAAPVYIPSTPAVYGPPEATFEQWLTASNNAPDSSIDAMDVIKKGPMTTDYRTISAQNYGVPFSSVAPALTQQNAATAVVDQISNTAVAVAKDAGKAISNFFSPSPAPAPQQAAPRIGTPAAFTRSLQVGSPGGGQQTSFAQDFNSVVGTITGAVASIFGPVAQRKQQVAASQAQRKPSGARGNTGSRGAAGKGGKDDLTTYLYIGGGALLLMGVVFLATKD